MVEKIDINAGAGEIRSPITGPKVDAEAEMILTWQSSAKKWRSEFDVNWPIYRRAYKGRTWDSNSQPQSSGYKLQTSGKKQLPEINICRSTIQSTIPILTDTQPGFNPIPPQPQDFSFSKMLGEQVDHIWDAQDMPIKIVEVLTDQSVVDYGVTKTIWNPELEDGLGDVEIEVIDPDNIWVNKGTADFDRNCKFVIERFYKTVGEAKRKFPKKKDKIKADTTATDKKEEKGNAYSGTLTLVSPVDQDKNKDVRTPNLVDDNKIVEIWECWYDDDTLEEYELTHEDGKKEKGLKKKFPNGHLTTLLPNQKLILQSVQNPYEGQQKNPYTAYRDTIVPRCIYGEGQVGPLMDIQKVINKTCQNILEIMRLMSNPVWIVDKDSGVNLKRLTNKIGLIVQKLKGAECRRDFPPGIDQSLFAVLETWMRFADIASGIQDVTQGRKPAGITAAEAIETLQEAAQTRIRLKERNLNRSLSKLAKLVINRILQFYRGVRYQRISGESAEYPDFVEFTIEPITVEEGEGLQMKRRQIVWNPQTQGYEQKPVETAKSVKSNFDVKVATGTSLPFQKAQRTSIAFRLFEAGSIDREELLNATDWPNKEKVLQRIEEAEAQAAQAAQMIPQGAPA